MPDFDMDSALDPELAARQEKYRRDEERRAQEARLAKRQERINRALAYVTQRASWDAWVWPEDVPTYLEKWILRKCAFDDLDAILKLIQRVYELDYEHDSDMVEAVCDHFSFDMDSVESAFRHGVEAYDDAEDYARNYCDGMGDIPEWLANYVDYEKMGQDFLHDVSYTELPNGRLLIFRD